MSPPIAEYSPDATHPTRLLHYIGFGEEDLELLWKALEQMFEHYRSAARGEMATRGLYVFKHSSELGNAPAHSLFARIRPNLNDGITIPRDFGLYQSQIDFGGGRMYLLRAIVNDALDPAVVITAYRTRNIQKYCRL
jgi:CRISPR/Cas system type I-B associated protein Csh2 (Cas7 group RAMP superfamily)